MAALIYLAHPAQVESVVWISSLRGLLATMFALLFLLYALERKSMAVLFLICGLLCKPTMISIFLFLLFFLWLSKEKVSRSLKVITLMGILLSPIVLYIHKTNIITTYFSELPLLIRLQVIIASSSTYLLNVFMPFRLSFDNQINPFVISYLNDTQNTGALFTLGPLYLLLMIALTFKKKTKMLGLLGLSPFLLLSPHMGLILHDFANISVVSDRYLNLPLFAFSLFLSLLLFHFFEIAKTKFKLLPPYSMHLLLIVLLPILTLYQTSKWNHPEKLLKSSQVFMELREPVLTALANQKLNHGDYRNARIYLKSALTISPNAPDIIERLIEINEDSPSKEEDQFIMNYIANPNFRLSPQLYLPLAELYLKYYKIKKAQYMIELAISNRHELKSAYLLQEKVRSYEEDLKHESFRNLELYYQIKNNYPMAIKYNELLQKAFPLDQEIKRRNKFYREAKPEREK